MPGAPATSRTGATSSNLDWRGRPRAPRCALRIWAASDPVFVVRAVRRRPQVAIMPPADAVRGAHRRMARSKAAHARQLRFNFMRCLAEVSAAAAALLDYGFDTHGAECHWPNRVQKPTNTCVDSR